MPARNGTGPQGVGPLTGRGMGFCVDKNTANSPGGQFFNGGFGQGRGRGLGRGFGFRAQQAWNNTPISNNKEMLQQQAVLLEQELQSVKKQIEDFKEKS